MALRPFFVAGSLLLASSQGSADIVHLKNGRKLEGTTGPGAKKGTLEVRQGDGTIVVISEADVEKVEKKEGPLEEFERRLRALPAGELDPLEDLLVWARDKQLSAKVKVIAKKILEINPDHELARKELGYVVYENKWTLESDLRKKAGLVRFRDEWVTQAEKNRRLDEEGRKELEDLLGLVGSENSYVQEFSVRKVLSRRDDGAREVFEKHLRDSREVVRMIALRGLMNFPRSASGAPAPQGSSPDISWWKRMAGEIHRLTLEEESEDVLKVAYAASRKFFPSESFRLALETARASRSERERQRAGEILYQTLYKAVLPDLCRALVDQETRAERKEVRDVLRRALGVDFGYDTRGWLRYWDENQARFKDEN